MRALCAVLLLALAGCGEPPGPGPAPAPASPSPAAPARGRPRFRDATGQLGVHFRHSQGTKLFYLPQVIGPGVALLDADGDGYQDAFFVQGSGPEDAVRRGEGFVTVKSLAPGRAPAHVGAAAVPRCELYRNTGGAMHECAARAGVDAQLFGMAALAFDADNDGYDDLLLTGYLEPPRLYRNNGDGTFTPGPPGCGIARDEWLWPSSATAIDRDRDGLLDVYLGIYIRFEPRHWVDRPPMNWDPAAPGPETLLPTKHQALPDVLMANRGDGSFEDRTRAAGLDSIPSQAMSVIALDMDGDGWQDLMTANDGTSCNRVFRNEGGRFADVSVRSGASEFRGSMGIAGGDLDLDGRMDVFVTHWTNPTAFYRGLPIGKNGQLRFLDRAERAGLILPGRWVGWSLGFVDVENDGFEDLVQVHGDVEPPVTEPACGRMAPMRAALFHNDGRGTFAAEAPRGQDDPLARLRVGRGAAIGDLDRDGTADVALTTNNGPAEVWLNQGAPGAWIGLVPAGTRSNRDGFGLRVALDAGGVTRLEELASGEGYFGTHARPILIGLGAREAAVAVRARWPSGLMEEFPSLTVRRYHRLVEGSGVAVSNLWTGR